MVVKNGSINAVYLEHCRVVKTSPFTEQAFEKLRPSTSIMLENVERIRRDMRQSWTPNIVSSRNLFFIPGLRKYL